MILRQCMLLAVYLPTVILALSIETQTNLSLVRRHGGDHDMPTEHHTQMSTPVQHGPAHSHGPPKDSFDPNSLPIEPISYFGHDIQDSDGHGHLMAFHIAFMTISWFGFLPLALFLRTAKHPLHHFAQLLFLGTNGTGLLFARIYRVSTEDFYPNNKHVLLGWIATIASIALFAVDGWKMVHIFRNWRNRDGALWMSARPLGAQTYSSLPAIPQEEDVDNNPHPSDTISETNMNFQRRRGHQQESSQSLLDMTSLLSTAERVSSHDSNDTLHDNERHVRWTTSSHSSDLESSKNQFKSMESIRSTLFLKYLFIFTLRFLFLLGYATWLLGIVVYSGKCRSTYLNGCLAHLIKGSIFLMWGVLSYGRYLGAWAELGWAWNQKPSTTSWRRHAPSAEFVECLVIFLYGATNTWMERFGAKAGDAFSIHEIQHISIAVMFWGAGCLGILLESPLIRNYLAGGIRASLDESRKNSDPPSYSLSSSNPIPATVAAVTGLAMSAHHQEYVFAIQVHQLWGCLLILFGICRIATYTFLFLRPPASAIPSRPPTEALAAFFCACGGLVFMLSTEQVVFAAMASGLNDVMTFNNLSMAAIGILFAWQTVLTAFKAWAVMRLSKK